MRRSAVVFASPDESRRATLVGGVLALLVSLLGAVLALVVSRWSGADNVPLLVLLGVVAAAGVLAVCAPERVPAGMVVVFLVAGTSFLSAGMAIVGPAAVDGADNEMLFLIPVLYSAYFCRAWVTALVGATAAVTYGAALLRVSAAMPAARWLTTSAALAVVAVTVAMMRAHDIRRLALASDEAGRDPLTGLLNRRGLAVRGPLALSSRDVVSLLVVDVDHFKTVNDTHGHAVGDEVLVHVADQLRAHSRAADTLARLGGDEFALLLPGCDAAEAQRRAESLCQRVAERSLGWPTAITVSVGAASTSRVASDMSSLLAVADRALYAAKEAGRNTVGSLSIPGVPQQRVSAPPVLPSTAGEA